MAETETSMLTHHDLQLEHYARSRCASYQSLRVHRDGVPSIWSSMCRESVVGVEITLGIMLSSLVMSCKCTSVVPRACSVTNSLFTTPTCLKVVGAPVKKKVITKRVFGRSAVMLQLFEHVCWIIICKMLNMRATVSFIVTHFYYGQPQM